ncbi:MAG: hypothetical protein Q4G58_04390, partial [bacterium]|nr:hypothetical protein [bacterium]
MIENEKQPVDINKRFYLLIVLAAIVICQFPRQVAVSFYSLVIILWVIKLFINKDASIRIAQEEKTRRETLNIIHNLLCFGGVVFLYNYTRRIHFYKWELQLFLFCIQFGFIFVLAFYFIHSAPNKKTNWIGYIIGLVGVSIIIYFVVAAGNTLGAKKISTEQVVVEDLRKQRSKSGDKYKTVGYYANVKYADGGIERLSISPIQYYISLKEGDKLQISTYSGMFGIPWKSYDSRFT